ncbi:hypothetical protein JRQ81_002443 [Phrynocephalus forsythii]|uniref:Uncharacterized protein n=1 Tax=Phrynocephalus forsythii TaxID=171643 RepID=A0A9Q0XIN3_9SAUR|nr:hypothetical protein JRQ81_002443 [Phrynocephalus forsythii]
MPPMLEHSPLLKMSKSDDNQQFTIVSAIKSMDKMTSEVTKMIVKTEQLACDLIVNFNQPRQVDISRETEEKNEEELKIQASRSTD